MLRNLTVLLVACGLSLTSSLAARQAAPRQPLFRSNTQVVPVDVVVVDRDGKHIYGLTAADFALADRKKRQVISILTEVNEHSASPASTPLAVAATVKMDVVSNQVAAPDRLVVMVVDDLHIYKERTEKSKDLARDVVSRLGPPASMAVLFTSGDHSTEITRDPADLFAAIDTLTGRRGFRRPAQADDQQMPGHIDPEDDVFSVMDKVQAANRKQLSDFFDNMTQYKTLEDAARMLGGEDARRKAFVMISEGIGKDLTGIFDWCDAPTLGYHGVAMCQMMRSLWRAHVVMYAIDPRGHVGPQDLAREAFPDLTPGLGDDPASGGFRWNNPIRQAQEGLSITAGVSGGFAVTDTDDYGAGLDRIVEDISHYYLLGFTPSDPAKGTHALEVTIPAHPDWKVRFRKSYDPTPPVVLPSKGDPRAVLAAGVLPRADLPLRGFAAVLPGAGKDTRVALTLEVTEPRQTLERPDGRLHDDLTYGVFAANTKNGKVVKSAGNTATLTSVRAPREAAADTVSFQIPIVLTLPPGQYQLRFTATSAALAKGGSVYLTVDVPDFSKHALLLSGVVVGYADGAHVAIALSPPRGAGARGGPAPAAVHLPFAPSLDREFRSTDELRVYAEFTRPSSAAEVTATTEILDANDHVVASGVRSIAPNAPPRLDVTLPLARLAPAAYRVRVTVRDGTTTARRDVAFLVK